MRRSVAVLSLCLFLFSLRLQPAENPEKPAGLVLSVTGEVFIDSHQSETQWTAAPGMALFDGYTIRNVSGAVRFSFCAKSAEFTLAAGSSVTFRGQSLDGGAGLASGGNISFCDLPLTLRPSSAESRGAAEPPLDAPLTSDRKAEFEMRLQPIKQALAANPGDLSANAARIAVLQQFGLAADTRKAAQALALLAPEATWTRGVRVNLPTPNTTPHISGKTFALLIGISTYKYDPPGSLRFADKDAELFAQLLEAPRGGGLKPPGDIRLLTNENATRAAIDREVERLAGENAASPGSNTLVLFIAGHGAYLKTEENPITHKVENRSPYILTYDSNPQDPKTTGYPMDEFRNLIAAQSTRFGRVLIFIDICHANEIGPISSGLELEPAVRRAFAGENGEFGMMLATKTLAFESELFGQGHGAFTYYVVDGWNGAAAPPGAAAVEFADLALYVETGVFHVTNRKQMPEAIDPDPALMVAPDVKTAPGIRLAPASPLPSEATARLRQSQPPGKATIASGAAESLLSPNTAPQSFDAALVAGALLPRDPPSASQYLEQARGSVTPSQFEDMRRRLLVALENRGQETILRYLEGDQIPQTKDDFLLGAAYFEEALRLAPDSPFDEARILFCRGRALIFDRSYATARTLLERSIRLDPARGYAYNALGIAYLEQIATNASSFDAAIRAFHDAIRFAPYWAYPRHNLALAFTQKGDYAAAIRAYRDAMAIGPQYSYLPYNLALLYQRLNELPLAETYYQIAKSRAELNPHVVNVTAGTRWTERSEIWDAMGTLETTRKRWSHAESDYRLALGDDSQSLNARHNLALLLSRNGKSSEAEDCWKRNLAANPEHLPSLVGYADYLARFGSPEEARALYVRVTHLRPEYAGVHRKIAALWLKSGKPQSALAELQQAAKSSPDNPELLEQIGDLELQIGDSGAAVSAWKQAASHAPDAAERRRLLKKAMLGKR